MSDRSLRSAVPAQQGAAVSAPGADHVVDNRNRWSRVSLTFEGLEAERWYEFDAYMVCSADETASTAQDFAALGFAFRAQDRSEIDFARVAGLGRTSIDAHGDWLAGPAAEGGEARAIRIRRRFYLPTPAAAVTVIIRSWRNDQPFRILDPAIRPAQPDAASADGIDLLRSGLSRDGRIRLGPQPIWFRHGLVPGRGLVVKGQVIAQGATEGVLARLAFHDVGGDLIPPPYPDTLATLAVPAFLDIPVHRQAYRFTLKISPPARAATLEIGFATWESDPEVALVAEPDVFLDDDLRLANLADDAMPGAAAFLARLLGRLGGARIPAAAAEGAAAETIHPYLDPARLSGQPAPLRRCALLREGPDACGWAEGNVRLASQPAWALPEAPDWAADPFRSHAWRLAFHSLAWIWGAAESPDRTMRGRAVAVALSWSDANPWGQPADVLNLHPTCMAQRLEAMLALLGAAARDADERAVAILGGEIVRHAIALAEILAQNTLAGSMLELQVAAALLTTGLALPAFPLAPHWTGLALAALQSGFEALIDPDGVIAEPSYHRRLEILTLALALLPILEARPDLASLAASLEPRLANAWVSLVDLFEPDGVLPPFDDAPDPGGRNRWLDRLAASRIRPWIAGPPPGPGAVHAGPAFPAAARPGTLLARRQDAGTGWSAFTADYGPQLHPQDHRDCTSFTFGTGGLRWITEGGGRQPAARAHNVAIPDGREPGAGTGVPQASFGLGDATVHLIATTVHGPNYRHLRAFVLLEDLSGVAVLDRFLTESRPLSVQGFLHLDPAVTVALDSSRRVFGLRGARQLHIVPVAIAGRVNDVGVSRAWAAPQAADREPAAGTVLTYDLSGREHVAGGLLIAASAEGVGRLLRTVEGEAFRQRLTE
ncbi:heparinase II/III family protein [Methylobacterium sp. UNC378MF]|uniref:heparinase II/III family protein n=1 Tax=Methylobacterium sp. UNC378MF TaxID=1502748 RepID=UPI0011138AA5|nr:heparinase II/III family protein [Methylobacterium sp. UNC378MF]